MRMTERGMLLLRLFEESPLRQSHLKRGSSKGNCATATSPGGRGFPEMLLFGEIEFLMKYIIRRHQDE